MKRFQKRELGDGYYILYRLTQNGLGGFHPVNIMLYRDDDVFVREITDLIGNFLDFPEAVKGEWSSKISGTFYSTIRFVARISDFVNGCCCLAWMVQPDGRYWADDDGYGMEDDEEIWLYALMDVNGQFVTMFSEDLDTEKYRNTMRML